MNPDVAAAIASLRARRVLSEPQAAPLLRWARGEVVSLHWELRTALYAGVLLATTGVGLFLKDNQERVGPAAIAALLGLCAGICLLYVFRRSPPFSWQATPTPHIAVDYVLLLGVLLLGSGIAYVETQFRWLGPQWPLHLLILSLLYLTFAYRFDSRAVLSLALTSFAAWRESPPPSRFSAAPATSPPRCGRMRSAAGRFSSGSESSRRGRVERRTSKAFG